MTSPMLMSAQAHILSTRGLPAEAGSRYLGLAHQANFSDKALEAHLASITGRPALFGLAPDAVHIPSAMPNLLVRYENREYIADDVMPVVPVGKRSDKYFGLPIETMQTLARTAMAGNRGRPGEFPYSLGNSLYNVSDYGLIDFVSADEEANADAPLQPRMMSADILTNALNLAREVRVASVVFGASNYGSNTTALSGTGRWDNSASDPIKAIQDAQAAVFSRTNVLVMGELVWNAFRNNPNVIRYITGRAGTSLGATPALVDAEFVARALGLDAVIVGKAKYATQNEGATVASDYVWGKSAALIRVERNPNPRGTQTFAATMRFGGRSFQNQVIPELLAGVRGGVWVKITHSDAEQPIGGGNSGFLWTTAIS